MGGGRDPHGGPPRRRTGVRAYGLTAGEALWSRQPPGDGDHVVAHVSQDTADGVAVVLHHGDKAGHDETSDAWHVHLTGLDLRTGSAVWTRAQRADELGSVSADAREVVLGGGRVATARSRAGDTETTIRVLDAHTGDLQWERPLLEGWADASVLAAEPVVVSTVGPADPAPRRLHVMSASAERAVELPRPHKGPPPAHVPPYEAFGEHPVTVGDALAVANSSRPGRTARSTREAASACSPPPRASSAGRGPARTAARSSRWSAGVTSWS
ncbi:PQQ-binding-like beta-propeller repeat protein [Streptomyces sp. NPDC087263]|uniref:outer membrane protein assembly factor BamB family protein n=1 Tax=Streptomyces sp. NPDC087263 TaxID=3365773 RepID=UPI00381E046A